MDETHRFRTEITIETLCVTTIKKRKTTRPSAICSNCGHVVTDLELNQTEPVIADDTKMITAARPKTGEPL